MKEALQTVLEGLECTYMSCRNILINTDEGYTEEETYDILNVTSQAIILLVTGENSAVPMDKRVYVDLITNNNVFTCSDEGVKATFLNKLYEQGILTRERTIGELIEELSRFSPSLKVNVLGEANSLLKIVVDDTYTDKVILVGVEN